ncbi:zinc ribbon domain-containing protein [Oceanococcus atlanticus]|nr:hypothetical protein [Oceanococcus atlanticus]
MGTAQLTTCKTCGGKVSAQAPTCPHCGEVDPGKQDNSTASEASVEIFSPAAASPQSEMKPWLKSLLDICTTLIGAIFMLVGAIQMTSSTHDLYAGLFFFLFGGFCLPFVRDRALPSMGRKSYSGRGFGITLGVFIVGTIFSTITSNWSESQAHEKAQADMQAKKELREKLQAEKLAEWKSQGPELIAKADERLAAGDFAFPNMIVRKFEDIGGEPINALKQRAAQVEIKTLETRVRQAAATDYETKAQAYARLVQLDSGNSQYRTGHANYKAKATEAKRNAEIKDLLTKAKALPVEPYEDNLKIYQKLAKLDPKNAGFKEKVAFYKGKIERQKTIHAMFSQWDGSYPPLVKHVKSNMKDPSSYDHIETRFSDRGDHVYVVMRFRGKNSFGALIPNTVSAKINLDANTFSVLSWD